MAVETHHASATLRRAAAREHDRLERRASTIMARLEALTLEIANLEAELSKLRERQELLRAVANEAENGSGGASASEYPAPGTRRHVLKGRELREVAAVSLFARQGSTPIHYREWFGFLVEAGWDIGGRDPLANFLTNVSRAPLVERADTSGEYRIAPERLGALERDLAESQAELRDVVSVISADSNPPEALREHRTRLLARVRRLEGRVAESRRVLGGGPQPADARPGTLRRVA